MFSIFKSRPHQNSHRTCPDCGGDMNPYQCEDAIIDRCLACNSVWFDEREIGQFRAGLEKLDLESLEIPTPDRTPPSRIILSACPLCRIQLIEEYYAYNSKVSIKRCQQCQGILLSGEQVLRFADFIRVCKAITPHVKEVAKEQNETIRSAQNFSNFADSLNHKLPLKQRATMFWHARHGYGIILPIYDGNCRDAFPWVTWGLIIINICIFFFVRYDSITWSSLGIVPQAIWNGQAWITLLSSQYLHAGVLHLAGNCFFLWMFGDNVEDKLGPTRFFIFYTALGFIAGLTYALASPTSEVPAIGASGAISGIFGAYFILFPRTIMYTLIFGQIFRLHIVIYLVIWILFNLVLLAGSTETAWAAHLGGLAAGISLMLLFRLVRSNQPGVA